MDVGDGSVLLDEEGVAERVEVTRVRVDARRSAGRCRQRLKGVEVHGCLRLESASCSLVVVAMQVSHS